MGIATILLICYFLNRKKFKKNIYYEIHRKSKYMMTAASYFFLLLQPSILSNAIKLISSIYLAGKLYVQGQPSKEYIPSEMGLNFGLAIPIIFIQLGAPLAVLIYLFM